jgi:tetratricopeptide (TPR) repeat protein
LLDAAAWADARGDTARLVEAARDNSRGLVSSSLAPDEARIAVLRRALEAIGSAESAERAELLALLAAELTFAGDWPRRRALADDALALARQVGDVRVLCRVLHLRFTTIWTPETLAERMANTSESVGLATGLGDDFMRLWAMHWRAGACIEAGDAAGAIAANDESFALAERLGEPTARWLTTLVRGVLALIGGRLEEAEQIAAKAGQIAYESAQPDVLAFQGSLLANIRWEQGRASELLPLADLIAQEASRLPALRVLYALAHDQAGNHEEARHRIREEAAGIDRLPYDVTWLSALALLGEVAADVGDDAVMERLYVRMAPWEDLVVYNGLSAWMAVAHALGRMAGALGRYDLALRHFAAAERRHEAMGAPLWLARTRIERARVLLSRSHPGDRAEAARALELARGAAEASEGGLLGRTARALLAVGSELGEDAAR